MSVIYADETAAIIDHELWIKDVFKEYVSSHSGSNMPADIKRKNFEVLFNLRTPFMMDGQAQKVAKQMDGTYPANTEPKKKRRKIEECVETSEESHEEAKQIHEVFVALRLMPRFKENFLFIPKAEDFRMNNYTLRNARKRVIEATKTALPCLHKRVDLLNLSTTIVEGQKYLLPPNVRYICDDVSNILKHASGVKYDLVVMDPPWENKYIRRRKRAHGQHHGYDVMSVADVLKIPMKDLLGGEALLLVWCTNNQNLIQEFMRGIHVWGVQVVATWYWLKVTKAGVPVSPLLGATHGKLPYERVLLAATERMNKTCKNIPNGLVFCSVPSGIHSHKPPLSELVKKYVHPGPNCLELFARSLIPGWTSCGCEVLRLQHSIIFEDSNDED